MTAGAVAEPQMHTRSRTPSPELTPDQALFFTVLGHVSGAREIVAGTPNVLGKIDLLVWTKDTFGKRGHVHTREWIEEGQDRKAARHIAEQEADWGNVYTSLGTYAKVPNTFKPGKMRYCRDVPLPRHCFMLDDVHDLAALRLPPTLALETSPGNYQAVYRCDELLSPADAVKLATGAALLAGSDTSGSDATQIMRIPDTRNTKPKNGPDGWPVRLVSADGPTYSRAALARAFLPGGLADLSSASTRCSNTARTTSKPTTYDTTAWEAADTLDQAANLRPGGPLLTQAGTLRRLKPDHFINNILQGTSTWTGAVGGQDSYSEFRYHLLKALWFHGYPETEIRMLTEHLAADDIHKRGTAGLRADIDRILNKLETTIPRTRVEPSRGLVADVPLERAPVPRATRSGRPVGGEAQQVERLCRLAADLPINDKGERLTKRAYFAQHLNLTARRITDLISLAKDAGRLDAHTGARGLVITRVEINSPSTVTCEGGKSSTADRIGMRKSQLAKDMENTPPLFSPVSAIGASLDALPTVNTEQATMSDASPTASATGTAGGVCSPLASPQVMPNTSGMVLLLTLLRTAIRASFDRWRATEKLDRRTGELKRCNVTTRRVVADLWVAGLGLAAPDLVEQLIVEERRRRELAVLRTMSLNDLRAELRKADRNLSVAERREQPTAWLMVRVDNIQAELRQRSAEPDPVKQQRRKGGPVQPDQRAAAQQYERTLLDELDAVLGRDAVEVRPVEVPPVQPVYGRSFVKAMIERLKARKVEQEVTNSA